MHWAVPPLLLHIESAPQGFGEQGLVVLGSQFIPLPVALMYPESQVQTAFPLSSAQVESAPQGSVLQGLLASGWQFIPLVPV